MLSDGDLRSVRLVRSDVCKSKKLRGLGVYDLRLVNLAMLDKWRWRLLS